MQERIAKLIRDGHFMELLKGGGVSLIVKVVAMLAGFVFQWLITTYYGADQLGLLISSISVLALVLLVGKLGLDTANLRFVAQYKVQNAFETIKQIRLRSLPVLILMSIVASGVLYFSSGLIAENVFNRPELSDPIRLISFAIIPMAIYQFNAEGLRGLKRIKEYAFLANAGRFVFGALAFVFAFFILQTELEPATLFVIGCVVTAVFSIWLWRKQFQQVLAKNKTDESSEEVGYSKIFKLSIPLLLASSTAFLMNWTDTLILTYFQPSQDVAVYNIALKFAMVGKVVLMAINSIAAPKFAEFYGQDDMKGLGKVVRQSTKLIFWTSVPLLILFILFPRFFLGIYGDEYLAGASCLMLLAGAQFFSAISGSVGNILQMTGKQNVFQNIVLVSMLGNVGLNLILIPMYGIFGAAIAGFVTIVARNLFSVVYIYRNYGFLTLYLPLVTK